MFMQDQTRFSPKIATRITARIATPGTPVFTRNALAGLMAGTRLETEHGWRDVAMLASGDRVHTYDGGLRRIRTLERMFFDLDEAPGSPDLLVHVPGGALHNCADLLALPDQLILMESTYLDEKLDTPTALVRLGDLIGLAGIRPVRPLGMQQVIRPVFDEEEVVWANTGLLCHLADGAQARGFFAPASREEARNALRYDQTMQARPLQAAA